MASTSVLGLAFLGCALLVVTANWLLRRDTGDYGITTGVAALITFGLGGLAMYGYLSASAATAVVIAGLLGLKPTLHRWLERLEPEELHAGLKLLLISVVLLPVLPDQGFGPWQALNPYKIWWFVVLIAALSFLGYFAIKLAGPSRGVMLTALFGGMVSSTAVTLDLSRYARRGAGMERLLAAGVIAASATMFPRILLLVGAIQPARASSPGIRRRTAIGGQDLKRPRDLKPGLDRMEEVQETQIYRFHPSVLGSRNK